MSDDFNALVLWLKKTVEIPLGSPFCQNEKCQNFMIYSPKEIRAFGKRLQKISSKKVQTYQCLVCKKRFTIRHPMDLLKRPIRNQSVLEEMAKDWTKYQSLDDLYRKYKLKFGISKRGLIDLKDKLADKVSGNLILTNPPIEMYAQLLIREIEVFYKKGHKASVFFVFQDGKLEIATVNVCEDEKHKIEYLKLLTRVCETKVKIRSPYQYKNTEPCEPLSYIDQLFDDYLKKLDFKKWIVARNRDGLQIQMILFRFAYNNFYEQEQRPIRERGRISVAKKMNVLREEKLKRLSKK